VIAILWTYRIEPGWAALFEAIYGPNGDWAQLFRQAEGYRGTELLREGDGRYATIDRWSSAADFARFKQRFAEDYERLDARCEGLTEAEDFIGSFEVYEAAGG
jgi:heme-degrading monooxygenase HmoA